MNLRSVESGEAHDGRARVHACSRAYVPMCRSSMRDVVRHAGMYGRCAREDVFHRQRLPGREELAQSALQRLHVDGHQRAPLVAHLIRVGSQAHTGSQGQSEGWLGDGDQMLGSSL